MKECPPQGCAGSWAVPGGGAEVAGEESEVSLRKELAPGAADVFSGEVPEQK